MSVLGTTLELTLVFLSWLAFFTFAALYLTKLLFRDYEMSGRRLVLVLFASMFMLSCNLYELLLLEIGGVLGGGVRRLLWHTTLLAITTLVLLVIPFYFTYLAAEARGWRRGRALTAAACGVVLFWLTFAKIAEPLATVADDQAPHRVAFFSLSGVIARIGIIGVTAAAVLAGYGAVAGPAEYMSAFLQPVEAAHVAAAEAALAHSLEQLVRKRKRLALMRGDAARAAHGVGGVVSAAAASHAAAAATGAAAGSLGASFRSMASRLFYASSPGAASAAALERETSALSALCAALFVDATRLREERARVRRSRTCAGQLFNALGWALSLYCVYKLVSASINVVFDRHAHTDAITRTLSLALSYGGVHLDVHFWSQSISFLLVGVILFSSVRGFLTRFSALFFAYSSAATSSYLALLLAQLLGVYMTSSLLMIRMSLPAEYRRVLDEVLDVEFSFYQRWFDFIFIPSALLTIAAFIVSYSTRRRQGSFLSD